MDKESNHKAYPAERNFHAYDYRAKKKKREKFVGKLLLWERRELRRVALVLV